MKKRSKRFKKFKKQSHKNKKLDLNKIIEN